MAIVVAGIIGGTIIGVISHGDYSDSYSDYYGDYSNYSDYAEKERRKREENERMIHSKEKEMKLHVKEEVYAFKKRANINEHINLDSLDNAKYASFERDFYTIKNNLEKEVDKKEAQELRKKIKQDEEDIKELSKLITKINEIQIKRK